MENVISLLKNFKDKNILVIGDIMLDKYIFGDVDRISPEAPVQVVNVKKEKNIIGGAGNVCNNVASLGCNVHICGIIGKDEAGEILLSCFKEKNINSEMIFQDEGRETTRKIRIVSFGQQLLRVDYETTKSVNPDMEREIIKQIKDKMEEFDIIIVSDYAKGLITYNIMNAIINGKRTVIDPKPVNKSFYKGSFLITPNLKEASGMAGIKVEDEVSIYKMGYKLLDDLNSHVLITCGDRGMYLFEKNKEVIKLPTKAKEVYDVTGAGDTVIATLSVALSAGSSLEEAAFVANYAAGIVVGKSGTATTNIEEIRRAIKYEESNIS